MLLDNPGVLHTLGEDIIVLSTVLRELEQLERKKDQKALQYQIRQAKRAIKEAQANDRVSIVLNSEEAIEGFDGDYADNIILQYALENKCGILTNDLLMKFKAEMLGIELKELAGEEAESHLGYTEVELTQENLNTLIFQRLEANIFDLKVNEYLFVREEGAGEPLALLKWTGKWLESLEDKKGRIHKQVATDTLGVVEAKDPYQVMAMDSIETNQVTMLRGRPGTGKTFLAVNEAWNLVEKHDYRMIVFYNPVPSRNAIELGFYPGDPLQKFLSSSAGVMLKAKFGGEDFIYDSVMKRDLEVLPFVDLRGFDTRGDRPAVILILEAQNLTTDLLKMGLQRVDKYSKVIIDGDFEQQIDRNDYINDNGMKRASEVLRGQDLYGEVKLQNVYRSRLADIVDEM